MRQIKGAEVEIADEEFERQIEEYEEYRRKMIKEGRWPEEKEVNINPAKTEILIEDNLPFNGGKAYLGNDFNDLIHQ